ncbi:MAG: hypothetical protein HC853_17730 [Anaerolineae bacterium]|nr:hypothetical protein [Anaerolineae bacterium]
MKIQGKQTSRKRYLVLTALAFGLVLATSLHFGRPVSAKPAGIVMQQNNLPDGAIILQDNDVKVDEESHPLTKSDTARANRALSYSDEDRNALMNYQTVHVVSALVPSRQGVIINFSYQFNTRPDAVRAAGALRKDLAKSPSLLNVIKLKGGRGYLLKGDEGDTVYWFIGTKGHSLSLILVNGMDASGASALFESTVQQTTDQLVDAVSESQ